MAAALRNQDAQDLTLVPRLTVRGFEVPINTLTIKIMSQGRLPNVLRIQCGTFKTGEGPIHLPFVVFLVVRIIASSVGAEVF